MLERVVGDVLPEYMLPRLSVDSFECKDGTAMRDQASLGRLRLVEKFGTLLERRLLNFKVIGSTGDSSSGAVTRRAGNGRATIGREKFCGAVRREGALVTEACRLMLGCFVKTGAGSFKNAKGSVFAESANGPV
jgi:hypothetical protein